MTADPGLPPHSPGRGARSGRPCVSSLTYRSQAASPLSLSRLQDLLTKAKARNRRLGVTGVLFFDQNQFFQRLEGPPEGVAEVWDAVRADHRHSQVELIDHHRQSARLFGDWDMKFVCRERALAALRDGPTPDATLPSGLVWHMTERALRGQEREIECGLEELLHMGLDFLSLHGALFEPAARLLGEWWLEDRIRAVEITIALSHLQSAVRRVGAAQPDRIDDRAMGRRILVAAQPGEAHGLGVALVGDVLRRAGCRVRSEFPATIEALVAHVRSTRFDALNLCLSDVFDRDERVTPLAAAVRAAREASANPDLVILAGGRLFRTQPDLADFIGADGVYGGAAEALTKTLARLTPADVGPENRAPQRPPSLH